MIYIDNAATTRKKPISVIISAITEILLSANAGRGGHRAGVRTAIRVENTRDIIRKYFFDGNVIFTKNCTEALNLAINGLNLKEQVITSVYEHNSVLRTLKRLELQKKIKLKIIQPENGSLKGPLISALKLKTSMVVLSGMSNVTGEVLPIDDLASEIKKHSDAIVLVDVAQSAGHKKFTYENVDMIACSGHKGLHGLQGSGFLLVKRKISSLIPLITGGTGTSGNNIDIPKEVPEGLEAGTLNAIGIISLGMGVKYTFNKFSVINSRIERYTKFFYNSIKNEKDIKVYSAQNGIILCNVKGLSSETVADTLSKKYRICVRGGIHCAPLIHKFLGTETTGAVRFGFGINNNLIHTLYAAWALKKIAHSII